MVLGPATQEPQAPCVAHAISTRAPICHHSACCARANHQRRRDDRSLYRPNGQPIHGLRCNHLRPRPWEAADLPPFRRRAIPKGNRFGPGPSSATPPRRRHQLAGVARKILRRTRVFNLRRTKTKHSVHTWPMEAQRHGPGVSRMHKTLCRCWNPVAMQRVQAVACRGQFSSKASPTAM